MGRPRNRLPRGRKGAYDPEMIRSYVLQLRAEVDSAINVLEGGRPLLCNRNDYGAVYLLPAWYVREEEDEEVRDAAVEAHNELLLEGYQKIRRSLDHLIPFLDETFGFMAGPDPMIVEVLARDVLEVARMLRGRGQSCARTR